MTLDKAIIHCEEVAEKCAVTDGDLKCEMEHRQLAEWLKELKLRRTEQRWFPCSEKLPERGKDVLVTRHYLGEEDNNKSCYYTEVAARYGDDDNPDWISYSDEYKMHPKNHIVIAWQELPEPYKVENE